MDRRDFIKKATMAAAGAAVVSPVSAMLDNVTGEKKCKVLLINGSPRTDGNPAPQRDERPTFMNFIR
jgi:hypothetical protein